MNQEITLDQLKRLQEVVRSTSWQEGVLPLLEGQIEANIGLLLNPDAGRKSKYPDDYLRGVIDAFRWVLHEPANKAKSRLQELLEERLAEREAFADSGHEAGDRPGL